MNKSQLIRLHLHYTAASNRGRQAFCMGTILTMVSFNSECQKGGQQAGIEVMWLPLSSQLSRCSFTSSSHSLQANWQGRADHPL